MAHVASARTLARPPKKPRPGKLFRVNVLLRGELVEAIDAYARELDRQGADPTLPEWARTRTATTRTEALNALLIEILKQRGLLK